MDRDHYRARTKERNILVRPLHPEVLAVLKTLPRSLSGYVFVQEGTNRPVSKQRSYEAWRKAARAVEIDITLYAGNRHSFAMQALNAGVNESLLGEFLGRETGDQSSGMPDFRRIPSRRFGKGRVRKVSVVQKAPTLSC